MRSGPTWSRESSEGGEGKSVEEQDGNRCPHYGARTGGEEQKRSSRRADEAQVKLPGNDSRTQWGGRTWGLRLLLPEFCYISSSKHN